LSQQPIFDQALKAGARLPPLAVKIVQAVQNGCTAKYPETRELSANALGKCAVLVSGIPSGVGKQVIRSICTVARDPNGMLSYSFLWYDYELLYLFSF